MECEEKMARIEEYLNNAIQDLNIRVSILEESE